MDNLESLVEMCMLLPVDAENLTYCHLSLVRRKLLNIVSSFIETNTL